MIIKVRKDQVSETTVGSIFEPVTHFTYFYCMPMLHELLKPCLVKPDGTAEEIVPSNGRTFEAAELHEYVEGFIETMPVPACPGWLIVVNSDGHRLGAAFNSRATHLIGYADTIVGNAVFIPREMIR